MYVYSIASAKQGMTDYVITLINAVENTECDCSDTGSYIGFFFDNPFNVEPLTIGSQGASPAFPIVKQCAGGGITSCGDPLNDLSGCFPSMTFDYGLQLTPTSAVDITRGTIIFTVESDTLYNFSDWHVGFVVANAGKPNQDSVGVFHSKDIVSVTVEIIG